MIKYHNIKLDCFKRLHPLYSQYIKIIRHLLHTITIIKGYCAVNVSLLEAENSKSENLVNV